MLEVISDNYRNTYDALLVEKYIFKGLTDISGQCPILDIIISDYVNEHKEEILAEAIRLEKKEREAK